MTEDFKSKILKYLTGNLSEETGVNEPQFQAAETITNNLYQHMMDNYNEGSTIPVMTDIIKSNQNDNYLCYGRGEDSNHNFYGFMIILNGNFEIIQSTNEYTSGTKMRMFLKLCQGTEGNFFGVDEIDFSGNNNRFVMLNNVLTKLDNQTEYQFVMKRTYNFPTATTKFQDVIDIIKSPSEGKYFIYGNVFNAGYNYVPMGLELVINVGSANEWNEYKSTLVDGYNYLTDGGWVSWNSEGNIDMLIACSYDGTDNKTFVFKQGTSNNLVIDNTYQINSSNDYLTLKTIILNKTNLYSIVKYYANSSQTDNTRIQIYRINNGNVIQIYNSDLFTNIQAASLLTYGLKTDYINIYFWYASAITGGYAFYGGLINGNNVYTTLIAETDNFYPLTLQCTFNQFNFFNFALQSSNTMYVIPFIYNQFNYNGLEYENINSMMPNSGILYDGNGKIIFARNLYNKNINGNTTISTIEIPNTFLNNTTIAQKDLLSETNNILNSDTNSITKNIYETLDINFFNTLVMKNSNNPANEIINTIGAVRLNNSISQTLDYSDTIANKIRINYQDETNDVRGIGEPIITNGVATYTISIYVPKLITNIEIISNDENTSYQTITGSFEINKYYTLTQNVRVE